jgi:hypothetical protein
MQSSQARRTWTLWSSLVILLVASSGAHAEADSLMEDFGDILKMYHLFSGSDGRSHIAEMPVPLGRTASDLVTYFDRPVQKFTIGYYPDGASKDFHYAGHKNLLIYLQGTQIITTGDGKDYLLKPGMVVLADHWTGKGHTFRCVAKTRKKACVLLQVTVGELDRELPLPTVPTPGGP